MGRMEVNVPAIAFAVKVLVRARNSFAGDAETSKKIAGRQETAALGFFVVEACAADLAAAFAMSMATAVLDCNAPMETAANQMVVRAPQMKHAALGTAVKENDALRLR